MVSEIQKRVLELLNKEGKTPRETSVDSCSEVSRLVAKWLFDQITDVNIQILKGDNVFNTDKSHDILAVFNENKIFIIDPTIFQFQDVESILIYELDKDSDYLHIVQNRYGGIWNISENLIPDSYTEEELLKVISNNLQQS